jgi:ribosomal protein L7/L12
VGAPLPVRLRLPPRLRRVLPGAEPHLADRIRAALGLAAVDRSAPAAGAIESRLRDGRAIEAIKLLRRERGLSLRAAKRAVDEEPARMR